MIQQQVQHSQSFNPYINDINCSMKHLVWRSFVRGIFIGLGATIGLSIVITIATYVVGQLKVVPVLKEVIIQSEIERVLEEEGIR